MALFSSCFASKARAAFGLCAIGFALTGTTSAAQDGPVSTQEVQALDCAWWSYVTQYAYEDYAFLASENVDDPMEWLKLRLDYADYHDFSAGRAMLDAVFDNIDAGDPVHEARAGVTDLCQSFPAKAVDPRNVFAPMLGTAL